MSELSIVAERLDRLEAAISRLAERPAGPPQRWLTIGQAAQYSGLCAKSIRRLIEAGELAAHRPVRGRVLLCKHQIDAVILASTGAVRHGRGLRGAP